MYKRDEAFCLAYVLFRVAKHRAGATLYLWILYKDFKGSFKLLVDGKQTKSICSLVMENYKKTIEINNVKYEIEDVSASTLTKYKKELVESALANLI